MLMNMSPRFQIVEVIVIGDCITGLLFTTLIQRALKMLYVINLIYQSTERILSQEQTYFGIIYDSFASLIYGCVTLSCPLDAMHLSFHFQLCSKDCFSKYYWSIN